MSNIGEQAEELVESLIKESGWLQLPTRKFTEDHGREVAPMLEGKRRSRILPDFYVTRNGDAAWIEVKAKRGALWVTKNARYEHGMDKQNWDDYHKISDVTGMDVWIFLYECDTSLLLRQSIEALDVVGKYERDEYPTSAKYDGPMVFFKKTDFDVVKLRSDHVPTKFFGQDRLDVATDDLVDNFTLIPHDDDEPASDSQSGLDSFVEH